MHPDQRGGGTIDIALACPRNFTFLQCTPPHLRRTQWYVRTNDSKLAMYAVLSRSKTLYPAESVSLLRGHPARRNWSRTPARRLPLAPPSGRTNDPASSVRSGTGVSNPQKGTPLSCQYSLRNPKDVWQHPSPAPEVQKLYLSHPGFEPKTCPFRERAANQLSQSEIAQII